MTPLRALYLLDEGIQKKVNNGAEKLEKKTGMTRSGVIGTITVGACLVEGPLAVSTGSIVLGCMCIAETLLLNVLSAAKKICGGYLLDYLGIDIMGILSKFTRFPIFLLTAYGIVKYFDGNLQNLDRIVGTVVSAATTAVLYLLSPIQETRKTSG